MNKKWLLSAALLAAALSLILLWSVAFAASENTYYVDENGNTQTVTATVVDTSTDTLASDWYVVKGNFTRNGTITVSGDAHLILADGASLTINGSANYAGVNVSEGNSLTIYGQEAGTGKLTATGGANGAGIGGGFNQDVGTIVIRGGEITANGKSDGGAGIGGGLTTFGKAGGTIIISGGKVNATGSGGAAAIGGGAVLDENSNPVGGTIIISGGEVTAAGGNNAAAIGGGIRVSAGSITISGGKVNVTGGDYAAAIGGGLGGDGGIVAISGGTVFARATSAYHHIAIGSGPNGDPGTIVIDGGSVKTDGGMSSTPQNSDGDTVCYTGINLQGMSEKRVDSLTAEAGYYGIKDVYTDDFYYLHLWLPAGKKITAARVTDDAAIPTRWFFEGEVAGGTSTGFLFQQDFIITSIETGYTYLDDLLTITQPGDYIISQAFASTMDRIRVNVPSSSGTVNITFDNVNINASSVENATAFDMTGANVHLKLVGTNSLSSGKRRAGLLCPHGASLTITADSTGSLTATGGQDGAGIGGMDLVSGGNITINGGTVTANSGGYAAGIGSGFMWDLEQIYVNRSNITINGGIVTANGGKFGAGIGGGPYSGSGTVVINNGKVTATGGEWGAGIGSGEYASPYNNNNTDITINGGEVQAHGGAMAAGIGGGVYSGGGIIRISDGKVTAGGGPDGIRDNEEISGGAGIGSGGNRLSAGSYGSTITISGGEVTATGAYHSAGIGGAEGGSGGGYYGGGGTIIIKDGEVAANGGILGAGIGGGYYKNSGNINIEGGTIRANGGGGAAGIGAGRSGSGDSITIKGGTVTATGGSLAEAIVGGAGIGSGGLTFDSAEYTSGGSIIIEGGTVTASGGRSGAGIGGGSHGHDGSITIKGGTVTATGGQNQGETTGAGIGGGEKGSGAEVVITGGSVKASGYEAIGKGKEGSNSGSRTNGSGRNVYLNTLTLLGGPPETKVSAGSINGVPCAETPHAAAGVYGIKDVYTDSKCNVYFYLPPSSEWETVQLTAGETTYGASYRRYYFDNVETLWPLSDVTFTAEQVGGASGTADSTGIKLTFSQEVDWLSERDITIENHTGRVERGELSGSGDEWTIALNEVEAEGTVIVSVRNFGSYNIVTPPQIVTVYKQRAFIVTGGTAGTDYTYGADGVLTFIRGGTYTVSMAVPGATTTTDNIAVTGGTAKDPVRITLDGVSIDVSAMSTACAFELMAGAVVDLTLESNNSLKSGQYCAGLQVPENTAITIGGQGSLFAWTKGKTIDSPDRYENGAGIGGGAGENGGSITITGGTITAQSTWGAGIGGGGSDTGGSGGTIIISGGKVNVSSSMGGAGIGGGTGTGPDTGGSGGNIEISGGEIVATGSSAAGIGGGMGGDGGNILITGGTVTATGSGGAGIGGGHNTGDGGNIEIRGGSVAARSDSAAGIGGGGNGGNGVSILISGGTVIAESNYNAGIGGGYEGGTGTVSLTGGVIYAQGGDAARDIGPGKDYPGADGSLTISDTAAVFLRSGLDGCITPVTSTHSAYSLTNEAAGDSQYGIPVPWAGDFGAYLRLYTLEYSTNGGTGTPPPAVTQHISTATAIAGIGDYTRTGYTLGAAWNSEPDGSGDSYAPNAEFEFTANTTLYAQWIPIQYNITYNLNGGTNNPANPATYTVEDEVTLLDPAREGYIFTGWTGTGITGDDPVMEVTIEQGSTGGRTYTAHWALPFRTLTDTATGISVSGYIRSDAALVVGGMVLHGDACEACNAIRQWMNNDDYVLLLGYDISLTQEYSGTLAITIPVDAQYNGLNVTILHCAAGTLNTYTATVADGEAVFNVTSLSPFAVFAEDDDPPTVATGPVTKVSATGAKLSGTVIDDGGAEVIERGFVYSKGPDPVIGGAGVTKVAAGSGTGSFTAALSKLKPNTAYYVRAYATNSEGTAYGAVVRFKTDKEWGALPATGGRLPWTWWLLCGGSVMGLLALVVLGKPKKA